MIEQHISIDIEQYVNGVKDALQSSVEAKTYQNFGELGGSSLIDQALVNAAVVSVCIDAGNMGEVHRGILRKAISEAFCEHAKCKDILSLGEYVVGIFDAPFKTDIDAVLDSVGKVNALFYLVNKVQANGFKGTVSKGIGMAYGKVLLTKTIGGENPIYYWDGETVIKAKELSLKAENQNAGVYAAFTIYNNLKDDYQKLFSKVAFGDYYEADPVNIAMNKWIKANM